MNWTHVLTSVGIGALSAITSSCVTSQGGLLTEYDRVVPIQGYLLTADEDFVVEALNYQSNTWESVATGRSSAIPGIPANTIADNPDLFSFSVDVQLASFDNPASFCRWSRSCLVPSSNDG